MEYITIKLNGMPTTFPYSNCELQTKSHNLEIPRIRNYPKNKKDKRYWFEVPDDDDLQNDVNNWCQENLSGNWLVSNIYTYFILDETDAMAFKLRWEE